VKVDCPFQDSMNWFHSLEQVVQQGGAFSTWHT
jgi:hypothetical protein